MNCSECYYYEKFHDDAFYCEAVNDEFPNGEMENAEECEWFKPLIVEGDEQE